MNNKQLPLMLGGVAVVFVVIAIAAFFVLGTGTGGNIKGENLAQNFENADKSVPKYAAGTAGATNPLLDLIKGKEFASISELVEFYKNSSFKGVPVEQDSTTAGMTFESYELLIVELTDELEAKAFVLQLGSQLENQKYLFNGRAAYNELCNWHQKESKSVYVFQAGKHVLVVKEGH